MTTKEKAEELVENFQWCTWKELDYVLEDKGAKQCALICVDEQIELLRSMPISDSMKHGFVEELICIKQEIEKLNNK